VTISAVNDSPLAAAEGDNGVATGTLIARDVRISINSQVSLSSAW